ncbi:anaerobic ribonucleoside-triphosphate reductase activating protein [Candidatus Bathyarchaeota archaeon]|nr:MAG: anaerobic ribonucleoside-triphosphate reductase activating protein [Candidatus Bathyarchaeota archaeon]
MDERMRLGGILDLSTVDWYGNASLIVFFAGCNFRCPYCQNSPLIPPDSGVEVGVEVLRERIEKNLILLDAVVFTGGEPTLQPEGVEEAARAVRDYGLKLMLDTNGSMPSVIERLLREELIDRVALDVKAPLRAEPYGRVIGLPEAGASMAKRVEESLELCNQYGVEVEVRTTVAPGISDDPDFIREIARSIRGRCTVYYLQQFDNTGNILDESLKTLKPPTRERLMELGRIALEEGVGEVYIKTRRHGLERVQI